LLTWLFLQDTNYFASNQNKKHLGGYKNSQHSNSIKFHKKRHLKTEKSLKNEKMERFLPLK